MPRLNYSWDLAQAVARGEICGHCLETGYVDTPNGQVTGCRNCETGRKGPCRDRTKTPTSRTESAKPRGGNYEGVGAKTCGRCEDGLVIVPGGTLWTTCDCERGLQRGEEREDA